MFTLNPEVVGFHQEYPKNSPKRSKNLVKNYERILDKHPDNLSVNLSWEPRTRVMDVKTYNDILTEFENKAISQSSMRKLFQELVCIEARTTGCDGEYLYLKRSTAKTTDYSQLPEDLKWL